MPTVQDILNTKSSVVHCIEPGATVLEAIEKMNQHKLGALVVKSGDQVVGMFTERDVLRRVAGEMRNPAEVRVAQVMTSEVICCAPTDDLDDVGTIMKDKRIRHLPVCGTDGKLVGMVSMGDLNAFNVSQQAAQIGFLSDYIYGRA
jgi:CBS domain-containing protein